MSGYTLDVFYQVNHLDFEDMQDLIGDAYKKNYKWWADEIMNGAQRQRVKATFEEQMVYMNEKSLFRFIHRKGFPEDEHNKWHLEIVFNEMAHFLWVQVDVEHLQHFIDTYNLKALG